MSLTVNQSAQFIVAIDHQNTLEPMLMKQRSRFLGSRPFAHRDQTFTRSHDVADRRIEPCLKAQIAIGHDADDALALDHR